MPSEVIWHVAEKNAGPRMLHPLRVQICQRTTYQSGKVAALEAALEPNRRLGLANEDLSNLISRPAREEQTPQQRPCHLNRDDRRAPENPLLDQYFSPARNTYLGA